MGRLAGYKYREVVKRLKQLGFTFDRQAADSHEIWFNPQSACYTTIPNPPETSQRELCEPSSNSLG